jgi:hypothetical protein
MVSSPNQPEQTKINEQRGWPIGVLRKPEPEMCGFIGANLLPRKRSLLVVIADWD